MFRGFTTLVVIAALFLSGCAALIEPVTTPAPMPTPVESGSGVDNPNVFVDPETFQNALLLAIAAHDTEKLGKWMMTEPFLTGGWGSDLSDTSPEAALKELYNDQLGQQVGLTVVKDADIKALLGGTDPRLIPRSEAGVTHTLLVSGWGKEGRDEAVLFISRLADDSIKWHGWMVIKGGFSGVRYGGAKLFTDEANGYSVYVPKDYDVSQPNANEVVILAPGQGHPSEERAAAFILMEPANGRTADQVVEETKAELGPGFNIPPSTVWGIQGAPGRGTAAYVVDGLPGQDSNRQVFMVYDDLLYRIMFVPDNPTAPAYTQMEDLFGMVINTWHFLR